MSVQQFHLMTSSVVHPSRQQRGVVLFIALIVMVAMSLAALAMFRSVDTANLVAGNQSLKQSALNSTDVGLRTAMSKFNIGGFLLTETNTYSDSATNCYAATTLQGSSLDHRGIPKLLLDPETIMTPFTTSFETTYDANCKITNANGDVVRYLIDRQCDDSIAGDAATNEKCLVASSFTSHQTDGDKQTGSETIPLYRITVRVDGPRKTVSYVQAVIKP